MPIVDALMQTVAAAMPSLNDIYAEFLGVDPAELEGLTQQEKQDKVNDKMSLYSQKQMGSGAADAGLTAERYRMAGGIEAVAASTITLTKRNPITGMDQMGKPIKASDRTQIGADQVATIVQGIISSNLPSIASYVYRDLNRGFNT